MPHDPLADTLIRARRKLSTFLNPTTAQHNQFNVRGDDRSRPSGCPYLAANTDSRCLSDWSSEAPVVPKISAIEIDLNRIAKSGIPGGLCSLAKQGDLCDPNVVELTTVVPAANCDICIAPLFVGTMNSEFAWFHKSGTNYDLCREHFDELSSDDKSAYDLIDQASKLGDKHDRYIENEKRLHKKYRNSKTVDLADAMKTICVGPQPKYAPSLQVLRASPGEAKDGFLSLEYGFCPWQPLGPLPLDGPHGSWETLGSRLPDMNFSCDYSAMRSLERLPTDEGALPDAQLKRAATLLGLFAHCWANLGPGNNGEPIPPNVMGPWKEVCERMGRPGPALTALDYFYQNLGWCDDMVSKKGTEDRFTDEFILNHTDTAVKAFGDTCERNYILRNVEMDWFSRCLPRAVALAQQAVLDNDENELESCLRLIDQSLLEYSSAFSRINPHPAAQDSCCPVVLNRTILKMVAPSYPGEYSLNGLQNSTFHLLDIFLGRKAYSGQLGELAIEERNGWLPSLHVEFFKACERISVREYILRCASRRVRRIYDHIFDTWSGYDGDSWMMKHRLKMGNYLELGMKTSRTIFHLPSWAEARGWQPIDKQHVDAIDERNVICIPESRYTPVFLMEVEDMGLNNSRVVFDIKGAGLSFQPGDRIKVLPQNSPEAVLRTMDSLGMSASFEIKLNERWLNFMAMLGAREACEFGTIQGQEFLQYAVVRPLQLPVAMRIVEHLKVDNLRLHDLLAQPGWLDHFELWDFFLLCRLLCPWLSDLGLNKSTQRKFWPEINHLAEILPPLEPRQYSITSASLSSGFAATLEIVVGQLWYGGGLMDELLPPNISCVQSDCKNSFEGGITTCCFCAGEGMFMGTTCTACVAAKQASRIESRLIPEIRAVPPSTLDTGEESLAERNVSNRQLLKECLEEAEQENEGIPSSSIQLLDIESSVDELRKGGSDASIHEAKMDKDTQTLDKALSRLRELQKESKSAVPQRARLSDGRLGVCSTYLRHFALGRSVRLQVVSAPHFHLKPGAEPVVMFGIGTGIAPFRSFVRAGSGDRELWLFWGTRSREDIFYWDEWSDRILKGQLSMRVAFSRDTIPLQAESWRDDPSEEVARQRWEELTGGEEKPCRLDKLLRSKANQKVLVDCMQKGATFYTCGPPALSILVKDAIIAALQFTGLSNDEAWYRYIQLLANGRFLGDLFSSGGAVHGSGGANNDGRYPIRRSTVARHCHANDCWTILNGHVYDLTEFLMEHPGGPKILLDKAGRDCTEDYDRTHGLNDSRVLGMFAPYYVAPLKPSITKRDSESRQTIVKVILALVDQLLEACHVVRADWDRFPGLRGYSPPHTSFQRDLEVFVRFTKVNAKVVFDTLGNAFVKVSNAVAANTMERAQTTVAKLDAGTRPNNAQELEHAVHAMGVWTSRARDAAINLLESIENDLTLPAQIVGDSLLGIVDALTESLPSAPWR